MLTSGGKRLQPLTIVADTRDPRVRLFQQALSGCGQAPASVVDYLDLLAGRVDWDRVLAQGALLRIESPGRGWPICRGLLLRGWESARVRGLEALSPDQIEGLEHDRCRIAGPEQWYFGFCMLLGEIEAALAGRCDVQFTSRPADIALLFDKRRCRERLCGAGVPVPSSLGPVRSYEDLRSQMEGAGWSRVYLKINYGSAGSGVVAYEMATGGREQAWTSIEMVNSAGGVRLYNSRRIRRYGTHAELATLIDALCHHDVHSEVWIPKAGLNGRRFDLRVVAIGGHPTHVAVRAGSSPLTNLHLGNVRSDPDEVIGRMGPNGWPGLMKTCMVVGRLFPRTLHVGIDVAVTPGFRRHAVLEVNAFGDLLKGIAADGLSTYEVEIQTLLGGWGPPAIAEDGESVSTDLTGVVPC